MGFEKLGVMVDCSRNAVMSVPALKKFISILAQMGYNQHPAGLCQTAGRRDRTHQSLL